MSRLLEVEGLNVWFDLEGERELHAVQGVGFALEPGERLGLVGESGCGKTTTVLGLLGLLPPSASVAGSVLLNGVDILAGGEESIRPHRWVDLAIVFQGAMNALNPVRTIGQQIVEHGPVDALYHEPRHPYTRLLFAATPDLYGEGVPASIPGAPPRLDRPLVGCPFHTRCDRAFGRCTHERPLLRELEGSRSAACHLNDVVAEVV